MCEMPLLTLVLRAWVECSWAAAFLRRRDRRLHTGSSSGTTWRGKTPHAQRWDVRPLWQGVWVSWGSCPRSQSPSVAGRGSSQFYNRRPAEPLSPRRLGTATVSCPPCPEGFQRQGICGSKVLSHMGLVCQYLLSTYPEASLLGRLP